MAFFTKLIMQVYTIEEISKKLGVPFKGDGAVKIHGVAPLKTAKLGQASFLDALKYRKYLLSTEASLIILSEKLLAECSTNVLITNNPHFVFAKLAGLFQQLPIRSVGIHPTAVIEENVVVAKSASIGAHCVIGAGTMIGENTIIEAGVIIGENCKIGADCRIWANVTIYYGVVLGKKVQIHSGAVIGSDGFGLAQSPLGWEKVPQLGSVLIHDDVEIGANTTIDRGTLDITEIGRGSKLDNQIQVGHNVKIGEHTVIAGCTGIAGSTKIGNYCMIGGAVGINGHIEICDKVIIAAMSGVTKSITTEGIYSASFPAIPINEWRKQAVAIRHVDKLTETVKKLEQLLMTEKTAID